MSEETHGAEATILESLPNAMFQVELNDGKKLRCHVVGKARMVMPRLLPGDKVTVELSPFDGTRGRITGRAP